MGDPSERPVADAPTEFGKSLRACFSCRLVKTFKQFQDSGCDNCTFLDMEDRGSVEDRTTTSFTGLISVVQPEGSWAAKWTHVAKFVPGCYALALTTEIPQDIERILDNQNIRWHKQGH